MWASLKKENTPSPYSDPISPKTLQLLKENILQNKFRILGGFERLFCKTFWDYLFQGVGTNLGFGTLTLGLDQSDAFPALETGTSTLFGLGCRRGIGV